MIVCQVGFFCTNLGNYLATSNLVFIHKAGLLRMLTVQLEVRVTHLVKYEHLNCLLFNYPVRTQTHNRDNYITINALDTHLPILQLGLSQLTVLFLLFYQYSVYVLFHHHKCQTSGAPEFKHSKLFSLLSIACTLLNIVILIFILHNTMSFFLTAKF